MENFRQPRVQYLEGADIPPIHAPMASVQRFAERVRTRLTLPPGGNIFKAVKRMGGRILYLHLDQFLDESGAIYVHGKKDFDIILPRFTSPARDRFTVAHELGHYFLHSRQGQQPIVAMRQGSGRLEWEANWFAAELLMPTEEFLERCEEDDDDYYLADYFGVSTSAIRVRKNALSQA